MSETMENAALNSGEIADRTPAAKAEETKAGLAELSGIHENTLLNILAGIKEPDIGTACRIADALGICVRELCPDEEQYAVFIKKDTLAKLIVISEINGVEPDELIASILEKGIEENGFYD